jgi:hypothetical protein
MRALPALSGRVVIAALERAGFEVARSPFTGRISRPERFRETAPSSLIRAQFLDLL